MQRLQDPRVAIPVAIPVMLVVLTLVGWAVDSAMTRGKVNRGVEVLGTDIGGLDEAEVARTVADLGLHYAQTPVIIRTADGEITTSAEVLGIELDAAATTVRIMDTQTGGGPIRWLGSLFGTRHAEVVVQLGPDQPEALAELVQAGQPVPTEPRFVIADGEIEMVPGAAAERFDLSSLRTDALAAAQAGDDPIEVEATPDLVDPQVSDTEAQAIVDEWNAATAAGIEARAGERAEAIEPAQLRSWLRLEVVDDAVAVSIDDGLAHADLVDRFAAPATDPDDVPRFVVVDGVPGIEDAPSEICCDRGAGGAVLSAIESGAGAVELPLLPNRDERAVLEQYGIVAVVGEATTPHNCCESRVTNIQRFAELLQGTVLAPGESLSLNDAVGQRTIEKGFVEAGVIYRGEIDTDVGGGISQTATTAFQASFYGGLTINEYFAHTQWFSRYADKDGRMGIESTISWPTPDVRFTNNTEHHLLLWPTWTDTSLTVTWYGTPYAKTEVQGQDIFKDGECTVVVTTRLRTYPDGTTQTDTYRARYQPSDGIGCDGEPTNPDSPTPTPTPEPSPTPEEPSPTPEEPSPTPEEPAPTPEDPSPTPEDPSPTPEDETPTPTPTTGAGGL